jgi:hypothetical protein
MKRNCNNMKKILLLGLLTGLISASPLKALDLYITGSTAFRAQVFQSCSNLYNSVPAITYGDVAHGGDGTITSSNPQWCMNGQVGTKVSALSTTPLTIHGLFTGSIQGVQTVEQGVPLTFITSTAGVYKTNTPTIAFSDASGDSTPYPATGNFSEESVCVQPFVMTKSVAGGVMNNITNVTWDQLRTMILLGRLPLSAWTTKNSDTNTFVYLIQRTKDSGTRRCETAQEFYNFNSGLTIYNYDVTNNFFYQATNIINGPVGAAQGLAQSVGVVGAAGNNNANVSSTWGAGYVGGGDIKNELKITNSANLAISYLSMNDSKGVGSSNWATVVPFEGIWPSTGTNSTATPVGNTGTNDYSPITSGMYPCWGYEVVVFPNVDPSSLHGDQNLSQTQLGDQTTAGTILGVLDHQTSGTPLVGSIENEIELTKSGGAVAIRLADMKSSRTQVGGLIAP